MAFDEKNAEKMRKVARVLDELNGAKNCIASFVNRHSFFSNKDNLGFISRYYQIQGCSLEMLPPQLLILENLEWRPVFNSLVAQYFKQIADVLHADALYVKTIFTRAAVVFEEIVLKTLSTIVSAPPSTARSRTSFRT